jgi:hypothetical protein
MPARVPVPPIEQGRQPPLLLVAGHKVDARQSLEVSGAELSVAARGNQTSPRILAMQAAEGLA